LKDYVIQNITKEKHKWGTWFLKKHYAKRVPALVECFGLYDNNILIAVCSFSVLPRMLMNCSCFETIKIQGFELSRLVIIEKHENNLLSHFVSMVLNEMKIKYAPCFIVSYADSNMNHHGYIYQSTNWIYTGITSERNKYINKTTGKDIHERHIRDNNKLQSSVINENIIKTKQLGKYRYFYFLGSSRECKRMKKDFKYPILEYPKGENKRYDSSYEPKTYNLF
jgi:hypothetical protein